MKRHKKEIQTQRPTHLHTKGSPKNTKVEAIIYKQRTSRVKREKICKINIIYICKIKIKNNKHQTKNKKRWKPAMFSVHSGNAKTTPQPHTGLDAVGCK